MAVAGDVAGAAGTGSEAPGGFHHGARHVPVLAHAKIIVGAPDGDGPFAGGAMPDCLGKTAGEALDIGENAIAPLILEGSRADVKKF